MAMRLSSVFPETGVILAGDAGDLLFMRQVFAPCIMGYVMKTQNDMKLIKRSKPRILSVLLCASALLFSACTKKPEASPSSISAIALETPAPAERYETIPTVPYQKEKSPVLYDGKYIYGEVYIPYNGRENHPAVILCHGMNSHFYHLSHIAMTLAERGIVTYTFDFCGGSTEPESSGTLLEMSVVTEADDLRAVIAHVKAMDYVNPDEVYLLGMSQGGYVATEVAAEQQDAIAGMILLYPAYNINDIVRKMYPDTSSIPETAAIFDTVVGKNYFLDALSVNIEADMKAYKGPVLILHGDQDPIVPLSYSKQALTCFSDARLIVIEGAQHGFFEDKEVIQDRECMYFLLDHCPKDSICSEASPSPQS